MTPIMAEMVQCILQGERWLVVPFQILILHSISNRYKMMGHEALLV